MREPLRVLAAAALRWATRLSGRRVGVVLVYHAVGPRGGDRTRELVPAHSIATLAAQLEHARRRYRPVRASEIRRAVAERRRGGRIPLAVTFDDDLGSHVEHAAPVLARLGLSATFFVTGAGLDGPAEFWWQRLQRVADRGLRAAERERLVGLLGAEPAPRPGRSAELALGRAIEQAPPDVRDAIDAELGHLAGPPPDPGLSAAGLSALVAGGHDIGFHTARHYRLTTLEDAALARAMTEGRDAVAAAAGSAPRLLAYPHGRADERVAAAARAAGFDAAFTTVPHPVEPAIDPWRLPRAEPSFRTPGHFALQLAQIVSG
ncbi:MAG TPA: polysaccharide deacetylase family protein, partial [Solirubrobacter sp.]|nr:polysaccharide deacetylase family protein [Solirubrobacter sp.]